MTMPDIDFQKRREIGWKIYDEKIKKLVEPQEIGKFLVIDVTTGEYVVNPDLILAEDELMTRQPEAVCYVMRIGHPAPFRLPSFKVRYRQS